MTDRSPAHSGRIVRDARRVVVRRVAGPAGSAASILLATTLLAACAPGAGASIVPTRAPTFAASPTPSVVASPSSGGTPSPSPSDAGEAMYPGLPPIDPSIDGGLEIDTFARSLGDPVPASEEAGGPPWRFDTGDPDPSTHPVIGFGKGLLLVVLHGPIVVDEVEWYLLTSAQLVIDVPTGWSPMTAPDGSDWIVPTTLACPPSPMTVEQLAPLDLTDGLAACYGDAEITIESGLVCDPEPDQWATGPTWMEGGACEFEADPAVAAMHASVYGLDGDLAPGRYRVTGHFDDPQSRICREPDGDDSAASRVRAILRCRNGFVATSAEPSD
ncbi:MAG TPA: hypothetical protein VK871_08400 [Candidatus Limnocylindrales bacterium]|nr:hypothetical protein [Candidatus Limnocylindrales bacterium]